MAICDHDFHLLFLELLGTDAEIVHGFFDARRVEVEVDPGQLANGPDLPDVVLFDGALRLLLFVSCGRFENCHRAPFPLRLLAIQA